MLTETQQIGVGLLALGAGLYGLGIMLWLDAALMSMGNVLFLAGLVISIGMTRAVALFTRRDKLVGSVCLATGVVLLFLRWRLLGVASELFGVLNLFGNFVPTALAVLRQMPVIGTVLSAPGVADVVDRIAGKRPRQSV